MIFYVPLSRGSMCVWDTDRLLLYQWECPVGLGLRKGRLFSKKSLNSPCSFLVPPVLLVNPRAAREVFRKMSVTRSREIRSPGPSFFCSSRTCFLRDLGFTQLLRRRPDRRSFRPFPGPRTPRFDDECICCATRKRTTGRGDSYGKSTRSRGRSGRRICVPNLEKTYGTVLDELDGGLAIERQLELVAKLKN